jgi:mannosyltransferase
MLPILNQSFWRDEAFSVLLALKSPFEIISLTIQDTNPPLYYLLLHFWMQLFGTSEAAVRGLSFLFHILLVVAVWTIARRLITSTKVVLLVMVSVLLNPFLLSYAYEVRAYSLLAFLTVAAVGLLLRKRHFWAGLMLGLGILTHNFGIFNLAAVGIWWLWQYRESIFKAKFKDTLRLFSLPSAVMLVWGAIIWNQWAKVAGGFWIETPSTSVWLLSLEKYSSGTGGGPLQSHLYLISFVLLFFGLSYWIWKRVEDDKKAFIGLLCSLTFVPTAITYVISALFSPIYHERYLISAVPFAIIMIGYSLWKLHQGNPSIRNVLLGLISIYLTLVVIASEQLVVRPTKAPINYAVDQVLKQAQPGDVVVPEQALNFLETKFYLRSRGSSIPVYAFSEDGKIPFYIGGVLYEPQEVIQKLPTGTRVWQIQPDATVTLITQ